MSDLQKAWAKSRLSAMATDRFDEAEEDGALAETGHVPALPEFVDDDSSSASSASSTGTIVPEPSRNLFARPQGGPRGRTMEQIPWTAYFERELFLNAEAADDSDGGPAGITHHVYVTSPVENGPLFVMHHGGGSCALSFAVCASEIRKRLPNAGILSVDARGHGLTSTISSPSMEVDDNISPPRLDLSLPTLTADLHRAISLTRRNMGWSRLPPLVLVGHSVGGSVVVDLAGSGRLSSVGGSAAELLGYAVLDVVEGSAIDALQSMQTYLSTRPVGFASLATGIEWHVRSRTIRNSISARTSVPGLLVHESKVIDGEESRHTQGKQGEGNFKTESAAGAAARPWQWRTNLGATQPFWEGWFAGLSKKFLAAKGGKLLLLAGTDRLDTELTIGQMQGKYALQVFPEAGHFIQEDLPERTAIALVDFYRRNDRSSLVLPPKVSDMLAQGRKI